MPDATKVSTGKPKVSGAVYRAPFGTTLPANATEALDEAFKSLGYISEDGLTNSNSPETNDVKAWGGDTVLSTQTGKPDTFAMTFIEALNGEVLKAVYGDDNVSEITVGEATQLEVIASSDDQEYASWVFDMILKGGKLKRIIVPNAKITNVGDIVYKDDTAIAYPATITAVPHTISGKTGTHWEYIA